MQLIWLSGPTARVVTISITRKTIWTGLAGLMLLLVTLGATLQWLGLRVAIELRPELARTIGAVTSTSEQQRIEQHYQEQLSALENQIEGLTGQLIALEKTKRQVIELIPAKAGRTGVGGQGGPFQPLTEFQWFAPKASERITRLFQDSWQLEQRMLNLSQLWSVEKDWLALLPLQPPISEPHHLSSGFGLRRDPFTQGLSRHEGIDYVAPIDTPILASAPGRVVQARYAGPYGLMVEVEHAWGFSTRYAHLNRLLVEPGQQVNAGDPVGLLGNTGRSTGPHLHYEVRFQSRAINPQVDQVIRTARQQSAFPPIAFNQF